VRRLVAVAVLVAAAAVAAVLPDGSASAATSPFPSDDSWLLVGTPDHHLVLEHPDGTGARTIPLQDVPDENDLTSVVVPSDLSPDGRRVAYLRCGHSPNVHCHLWVVGVDGSGDHEVVVAGGDPQHLYGAAWSPDGRRLAVTRAVPFGEPHAWVIDDDGGHPVDLGEGSQPDWAPTGDRLVVALLGGPLEVRSAANGAVLQRLAATGSDPAWSPDGARIAFVDDGGVVRVVHPDGSGMRTVPEADAGASTLAWAPDSRVLAVTGSRGDRFDVAFLDLGGRLLAERADLAGVAAWANPSGVVPCRTGQWTVDAAGRVAAFGAGSTFGDLAGVRLNAPVVGITAAPGRDGYWLLGWDGGVFTFGRARFHGSTGALRLNAPVLSMSATGSGEGYWLVAADGGIFTFGDAPFFGSTGALRLNQPVVALAPTPSGRGYWLVARDGGIFTFGDAGFFGSTGDLRLRSSIVAMAPTASGRGYWLIAGDGGVFTFGDATFPGSGADPGLGSGVVGAAATPGGFTMATADGQLVAFGDAEWCGAPRRTIVAVAAA
jgi:hypothetical protein